MIKVTVELKSARGRQYDEVLGIMEIWNTGKGTETQGEYEFRIFRRGLRSVWLGGSVGAFPRKRLLGWDLLYRCLRSVERIVKENPDALNK